MQPFAYQFRHPCCTLNLTVHSVSLGPKTTIVHDRGPYPCRVIKHVADGPSMMGMTAQPRCERHVDGLLLLWGLIGKPGACIGASTRQRTPSKLIGHTRASSYSWPMSNMSGPI